MPYWQRFRHIILFKSSFCWTTILSSTGRKKLWQPRNVILLLDCYKLMKEKFNGTKSSVRHSILYAHIATIMNQFEEVNVTGKQCKGQMNSLRKTFFEEYDGTRGTGQAPSQWPFFKAMKEIFKGDANLDAPFVASVGNAVVSYTARGKEQPPSERNTRTRPTTATEPSKDKQKPPKKSYKSWGQEVQNKQIEQRQALVDEVRLLRLNFEIRSAQRMEMLKKILEKLWLWVQYMFNSYFILIFYFVWFFVPWSHGYSKAPSVTRRKICTLSLVTLLYFYSLIYVVVFQSKACCYNTTFIFHFVGFYVSFSGLVLGDCLCGSQRRKMSVGKVQLH